MAKILVTGGAGFIGSHLCEALLHAQHHVIVIDNFNNFYDPKIKEQNLNQCTPHPHFTLVKGDIRDYDCVQRTVSTHNIRIIIHLAAMAGVRPSIDNPSLYFDVNINGTLNILEIAKQNNIEKLLFASSSSVYGNNDKVPFCETDNVDHPISPYAASKKANELMAYTYHHLYQIPMAGLRFFTVYGPRQRPEMAIHKFTNCINTQKQIPVFANGNCLRDYTYIDDIISGIMSVLNTPIKFDIVNLGNSDTTSTRKLIRLIEKEVGRKADLKLLPKQAGDVDQTFADITHAKKTYGYTPQFPIEKGIKEFIKWYNESHH